MQWSDKERRSIKCNLSTWKAINKKVIIPDDKEIIENSRAKSAKLRIAEKIV